MSATWQYKIDLLNRFYDYLNTIFSLFPTLIPISGVVQHVFHHVVIKIRQLFLRLAACLTSIFLGSTLLKTSVGDHNCKCSNDIAMRNTADVAGRKSIVV
jgi:hypothetical protein